MERSTLHTAGANVKSTFGGRRAQRNEQRGSRMERRLRRINSEGFEDEDEDSSDWWYGFIFIVFLLFVLSPGVLLTLPPGRGGVFMSGSTSTAAAFIHAVLITVVLSYL